MRLVDDDVPAVTVEFNQFTYDAFEGGSAATVTVTLSQDPERTVTVLFDVSRSERGGQRPTTRCPIRR